MAHSSSEFVPAGYFHLRTPLLSAEPFLSACSELGQSREAFSEWIWKTWSIPVVQEAIFLSSPALHEAAESAQQGRAKVEESLAKYVSRMSTRCTPFGLLAGCTYGVLGDRTSIQLAPRSAYRRSTKLDLQWLLGASETYGRIPEVSAALQYQPNPTLYEAGGRLRYIEQRIVNGDLRYCLTAVHPAPELHAALNACRVARTPGDLARRLAAELHVEEGDALQYVQALVEAQIIVADLDPTVTSTAPVQDLVDRFASIPPLQSLAATIDGLQSRLSAFDTNGHGAISDYREFQKQAAQVSAADDLPRVIHVQLVKPAETAMLHTRVTAEILRGVAVLERLCRRRDEEDLSTFASRFEERFGDREVPLLQALDDEFGVGFGSTVVDEAPLVAGLEVPGGSEEPQMFPRLPLPITSRIASAIRERAEEIVLDEEDVRYMPQKRLSMCDDFSVLATVCAESGAAVDRGRFLVVIHSVWGPNAAAMAGRFCVDDEELRAAVAAQCRREQDCYEDAIIAEVVHKPAGNIANVVVRPVLRHYEIPLLGRSGADGGHQIPLDDLFVNLINGHIELRSRRHGCRVIPRLATAHNVIPKRNLSIYRFLGAMQEQDKLTTLMWPWGELMGSPYLPSVRIGRAVLARARWRINGRMLRDWRRRGRRAVEEWREAYAVPRFVMMGDADRQLVLDLDNETFIDVLLRTVQTQIDVFLYQLNASPSEHFVQGPEGLFAHEMLIPFYRPGPRDSDRRRARPRPATWNRKSPRSDWVYAKYYAGSSTAERLLSDSIVPTLTRAIDRGDVDRWFFIRFRDPEWHIRIRAHTNDERARQRLVDELNELLEEGLASDVLWRYQFDTYDREVNRYGGQEAILLAEELFHVDSMAVARLLSLPNAPGEARWMYGLAGVHRLLSDFQFSAAEKRSMTRNYADGLLAMLNDRKGNRAYLAATFREWRTRIGEIVDAGRLAHAAVLDRRSALIPSLAKEYRRLGEDGRLSRPLGEIAMTFVHMYLNRLLQTDHRRYELVVNDFLAQHYQGESAREHQPVGNAERGT